MVLDCISLLICYIFLFGFSYTVQNQIVRRGNYADPNEYKIS